MEIQKIKLHELLTCTEEESVKEIAKKLRDNKERRIFVIDEKEKLVGVITTTDLVYKALGDEGKKANQVMTTNVESVDSKEDLNKALEIMNKLKSFVCPVTEDGKIIGLISYHDLMNYVISSMQE